MSDKENDGINRRDSFRLVDTIKIRIRLLDENALKTITDDFSAFRLRYCMKSHVQNEKEIRKPVLTKIKRTNPDIAEYLQSLESQIGKLAERLDKDIDTAGDCIEFTDTADLSATGIRLHTTIPMTVGMTIEIGMLLGTHNTHVVVLGDVLRVEQQSDEKFMVSIDFSHIHSEDTEAIVRHLARLQQMELQARRDRE